MTVMPQQTEAAKQHKSWLKLVSLLVFALVAVWVIARVPTPTLDSIRQWSESLGAWFPFAFFAGYVFFTQFPIPRTVFTLSSGVLFGPLVGIVVAISATTVSAGISLLFLRWVGRDVVRRWLVKSTRLMAVDQRLAVRGWVAVLSLRLIAGVPFSVLNYACALSSIRFWPFVLATAIGSAPGTIAVVFLGDALIEGLNWPLLVVMGALMLVGAAGLLWDAKHPVIEKVR